MIDYSRGLVRTGAGLMFGLAILVGAGCTSTSRTLPYGQEVAFGRTGVSGDSPQSHSVFMTHHIGPGDVLNLLYQPTPASTVDEFRISVDQTLSVKFVNEPELSESQKIRPDGRISLPYLGSVQVIGKTVEALTRELKDAYSEHLRTPELYVVVEEFNSASADFKDHLRMSSSGLGRPVTVRPDGFATFPMLGEVYVEGFTLSSLNRVLNTKLSARYGQTLPSLSMAVSLEESEGYRIFVLGEVGDPGSFPINRPLSVLEALALAGSAESTGRLDSVIVVRERGENVTATRLNIRQSLSFKEGSSLFMLQPRDVVYVPRRSLASAAEVANEINDVLFFRGWGFRIETVDLFDD